MTQQAPRHSVCPWWIGFFLISPIRRWLQDPDAIIAPYVKEGMTVLEIGPGMGFFSLPLARRVGSRGRVICVDIQEKMLRTLQKRAARAGLGARITTVVATDDSLQLDRYRETADFTLAFAVVHEVADKGALFAQIRRAMKNGGLLLLSEPTGHVTEDDLAGTLALARENGFSVDRAVEIKHGISRVLRKDEGTRADGAARMRAE